uniref:Otogelin n=1 Tax=Chrysemys picta bellii TaxID=8478 RepID=A0A8C3HX01_CHRPI
LSEGMGITSGLAVRNVWTPWTNRFEFWQALFLHLDAVMCFNGGECVHREFCDCSRFNASGSRCQTVHNTGAERDNICRTWGQYHFETFDGLYYYFSGKSTYVLVRQNEIDEQSFSIQVNNDPECKSSPYSCKRSVSLFFSGDEEIKLSSEVIYKGFGVQLPHAIGNVHIQKLAGYILVRHRYAFTLAWDGTSAVYIKLTPDYLGKTHGLCGNNNAILQDELETSYGKLTEDIAEFVESWRENRPQGSPDWDNSFNYEPPCLTQSQDSLQKAYALCNTLLWPPFEQCHDYVSPLPFMASCTNDLCMSAADHATWCRALTEYARTCAQAGKPLHGWRTHFQQCVITCEEPLIYNECIDCCPVSCQQKTQCIDSELPCVDGCYCPDGLIYENELCVKPTECPCDYHGNSYRTGSVVHEECNNCTCIGGKWTCTNLTCPAECSVSGDINFMTFDGRKYTFQATCQYILAKSHRSGKFTVSLQNAPCGPNQDGSCIKSVNLILNQDPKRQVTLTHSGDVLIYDQYKISLPYSDDSFEIRKLSSVFLQVKTNIGLQILYDRQGLRLYLQVDDRWKDDTVGLCGTFNGNMQDDFLSPVGVPESTPQLFGNSWKTSSACAPAYDHSPMDPCDIHLQAASYASEACSIVTKELFAPCHAYLSPVSYFEQCRRDTCKCGQICLCSALANYAHQCRRHGVIIDFRSSIPDCALSCEDTKEYSTCVSTCGQTCQTFSMPETCSGDCVEGCACPLGMYLNSKTERCVQRNECPCYFQGIEYPPGENIITSLVHNCPAGQIYVNCSNPQANMELSRERTCENQLLNLTFSAHLPCLSGCVCPQGLVKHGDACFEPDECPCSWKGKEYFPGDKVISSCHTCICQHGSFQCTFHPCPSMCTAYGDRHYRTFDGLTFDFIGACKVHLVKSTSITSFSVITENVNCFNTGIICRKYISINVGKSFITFDDDTGNPSPSSYIDKLQKIHLWKAGFFTLVHFPNEHITILWDQRTTIHIQTGPQWQGELTGLCGNFDLKTINEMRTPENFELTNSQEFGSSWSAVECVDSSDIRNPCSLNPLREPFAKKECGILLSEMFEACHPVVDVTWFYSNCLTDTCGCNQGGDCECFCTSVSAYAHQCCQHGVIVDWRSPRVCPYDCEYFNKVLGKGPYKLVSYWDGEVAMAAKLLGGYVFPVRAEDFVPGDATSFMLTSGWYKPKAHDPNLVSFEAADRPNYFLHLASNDTLLLSKWEESEEFHNRSTFAIHKNTWLPGYSSFESFAKPGFFIHISASSVDLLKYKHSEKFRLSTLFKLVDAKFKFPAHSTCEWRYDACTSPCFKTCRDPLGQNCQDVPKVEGCVPMCPLHMVLDEVTQRCVYFEDCMFKIFHFIMFNLIFNLSTLRTSVTSPSTKSPHIFPTAQYLAETSVSLYTLTQKIPKEPATTKHPVQTETVSTVSKPTVKTVTETVKQTASTTQISLIKDYSSFATTSSVQTSSAAMVSPQIREESAIPRFTTKLTIEHVPSTPKPYLESKKSTTIYQPPTEILTTAIHPEALFSTTESIEEFTTLYPFLTTSRPAVAISTLSPTSVVPAKVLLPTEKESSLTDTVLQTYVPGTASALQTKLPTSTREKMDLTVSTRPLSFSSKVITTSSPLATMKKEFPSFPTQKSDSSFESTKQTAVTEPIVSSQTPTVSIAIFPLSKLTSPSLILSETSETPITTEKESLAGALLTPVISTASTSMGKSTTEKTVALSKQVPLSTTSYGSTFQAGKVLPATTRSSTTATVLAPSSGSSVTAQNITTASATSGTTAAIKEALTTSLFSGKPIYFSVASETEKAITSETAEPAVLVTKPQSLHTPGVTDLITPTLKTTQTFHSPYFTNITAVAASSGTTSQTPKLGTLSVTEVHTPSKSSLLMMPTHSNATMAASVPSFAYVSTKPLYESATEYSGGLTTAEAISGVTASAFMPARETATLQTCVPITENECIKHICLDGQLIQVNKSQNCPYNATQPSCGVLGLAVQINGDKCCPKWECACRCTFFSDLSFVTFDGNHLALFKEAAYIVSQTQDETITIHILDCRNTNMGHLNLTSLCLAMLNLTYLSNQIIIDRLNRKITVNSRYAWPTVRKYGFKIEDTGFMYTIETPTNIRIQWFHSTGMVIIESNTTSEPKVLGLCGFCDGSSANDLMLPNRTVLSKTDAPSNFIDSWQVPSTLKYVGEDRHQETNCSVMDCSRCFSLVLNQTFSSCHPYVPPELFCDLWVQDVEYIQNPCVALAAYVAMCNKFNICIKWRSSDYCSFPCSEDTSYQACIAACDIPSTCQNGEPTPQDSESCSVLTEGCVCSEGTVLHRVHSALCIPEEKCACTDSSGAPHAVGEIWKTSLSGCCMHKCVDNETIIPVEYNCSDIHDLDCQRFGEVALIVPDDQTCCPQKICICNQSFCESFIPECKGLEKLVTYYREDSCCPNYTCECDPSKCEPVEQSQNCREDQTLIAARVEGTCCISYICACGVCSDQIPKCQEGEVLTVDGNTTDRCCPAYQCVCETYRCHEFQCALGMSLVEVWSPEKCCPQTLGEKLQIDEQFQNSTENVCGCTKYKCGKDKVCLSNERGVLRPGQTIMEHTPDGICHTSYCTNMIDPSTKYYRINISWTNCVIKCETNQEYEPPKDLTTCCGHCKNVSCLHTFSNGTVSNFKPGTTWISNCMKYDCTTTAVGPVLITSSISCPPFNETECVKIGGYVVPFLEGCCKTCKEDGKFCKKVTVRMTIRKNDCRSNTPVNIVSCDGKCPSASIYNYNINSYARFCKCCRELGLQRRTVQLYCSGNSTWVNYSIQEPTDCSCQWS